MRRAKNPQARKPEVTVVGSFAVGLTLRVPRFPVAGETLMGSDFDMGPGGKGSNQAVCAARLGARSRFVARLGRDSFAGVALELYEREGVDASHVRQTAERNTGVGFIMVEEGGQNRIVLDPGANALLSPQDVDEAEELIAESAVVAAVLEIRAETAARAMELGRRHGALTLLNPAPATVLDEAVLSQVDVLTPNESELRILCGLRPDDPADTAELAGRLLRKGVGRVVVTRGEEGAVVFQSDGRTQSIRGYAVEATDTTGAGDAFNAALAVFVAEGRELSEAVRIAAIAGALTCTRLGVIPGLPRREDVEKVMTSQGAM